VRAIRLRSFPTLFLNAVFLFDVCLHLSQHPVEFLSDVPQFRFNHLRRLLFDEGVHLTDVLPGECQVIELDAVDGEHDVVLVHVLTLGFQLLPRFNELLELRVLGKKSSLGRENRQERLEILLVVRVDFNLHPEKDTDYFTKVNDFLSRNVGRFKWL
jgi:hypothetical protein